MSLDSQKNLVNLPEQEKGLSTQESTESRSLSEKLIAIEQMINDLEAQGVKHKAEIAEDEQILESTFRATLDRFKSQFSISEQSSQQIHQHMVDDIINLEQRVLNRLQSLERAKSNLTLKLAGEKGISKILGSDSLDTERLKTFVLSSSKEPGEFVPEPAESSTIYPTPEEFLEEVQTTPPDQPITLETTPEKEPKQFNAAEQEKLLFTKVKELSERPFLKEFFSSFHPDNIKNIKLLLSKVSSGHSNRQLGGLLLSLTSDRRNFTGQTTLSHEELSTNFTTEFKKLAEEFSRIIADEFPPNSLFGNDIHSKETAMARFTALNTERVKIGRPTVFGNLEVMILNNALKDITSQLQTAPEKPPILKDETEPTVSEAPAVQKEINEKIEPQEWLDQEREQAFDEVMETFENMKKEGEAEPQKWFVEFFNPALQYLGKEPLTLEDVSSLRVVKVTSESASQIAGKEINRPIFLFTDIAQYQKFSKLLQGTAGSRGMNLKGIFAEGSALEKTGMLISVPAPDFIGHEVRHSIDPHLGERGGWNGVLDEAFAYYQDTIVTAKPENFKHLSNPEDGPWNSLRFNLENDISLRKKVNGQTEDEYKALCRSVVETLRDLHDRFGAIEAQRKLVQCKDVESLLTLSKSSDDKNFKLK
jgi:hypothetical protein